LEVKLLIESLRQEFVYPGKEYRPAPFWFWNSKLDKSELERQIHLMHDAGIGGFFMHARFGLETEYMSDEWLGCILHAVEVAEELDMQAWLYDEYPFPSGVGGLAVTKIPAYRNKFVDMVEHQVARAGYAEIELPDGELLVAYAIRKEMLADFFQHAIRLYADDTGRRICWNAPDGDWIIMAFVLRVLSDERGNVFGPDYLNIEATKYFLSILDKYAGILGHHLGKTVPGIFTDEPCLLTWHQNHTCYRVHHDSKLTVWGDELPDRLKRAGCDWQRVLPAIFYDIGEESERLRQAYRQTVADNYIEAFFEPYAKWCEEHNLKLTGHLLLEEGLYSNTIFQGDFFRDLSYFHVPGADHLGIGCEGQYGGWGNLPLMSTNVQGQKLVSSIAHLCGKEAVLSESFGVSGWRLTMADMKGIVDWQYRLGINFLCPHAFYYGLEGFRKNDSPPSQFFHATYWKHYQKFADYVARLSLMLRAGVHCAKVALFYPLQSFRSQFKAGVEGEKDKLMSDCFNFYSSELLKCHYDYDIVPEEFFRSENVSDGILQISGEEYELVILPPLYEIGEEMEKTLIKFYQSGGKILASKILPSDFTQQLNAVTQPAGMLMFVPVNLDELRVRLSNLLNALVKPDVTISSPKIGYVYRRLGNYDIYFFSSDSDEALDVQIHLSKSGKIERWDAETGEMSEIPKPLECENSVFAWRFEPRESLLIVVDTSHAEGAERAGEDACLNDETPVGANAEGVQQSAKRIVAEEEVLDDRWDFQIESPNVLPLPKWNLRMDFSGDWQYCDYNCEVEVEDVPDEVSLLLDDVESRLSFMEGMSFSIKVNGEQVENPRDFYLDSKWKTVRIEDILRAKEGKDTRSNCS